MGALGGALIAKGIGKAAGNIFGGRPVFSGFGSGGRIFGGAPKSTQQYGNPTPLPTTPFSPGGEFSGKPFGNAPMGTGTLQPVDTSSVSFGGGKSGLSSILSGAENAINSVGSSIGGLFNGGGGGNAPSANPVAPAAQPSSSKGGLTGSNFGTGQENPNGEGVSADWSPIYIDGYAGPNLYGSEVTNAAK
jgi:hypothetical protein